MIRKKQTKSHIVVDLTGPDGNAHALLTLAKTLCFKLDKDFATIEKEMTSGNYENLVAVFDKEFGEFVVLER